VKCKFGVNEITFLGYTINADGIKPIASRVEAIVNAPKPTYAKELRRYLGMINFYRCCITGAAETLQTLNDLLKGLKKSNALIEWSARSENAFRESKRTLANATMLARPVPISLAVDASNFAIGAVLQQWMNNAWQPLA
jgi:hypothetical protein